MDRIHRSSDLTQTFVFSGFNVSEVANIYFLLLDPVGNIVKQCAIVSETGFPSEDVSVVGESNVEVRLNRVETASLSYGKYTYQVRIAETNAAFEESVSVRSDAYPSLRVVADYEKTKQGENIEIEFTIGRKGDQGISAYDVAILEGFVGTEAEWLASLKGDQGIQGVQGDEGLSAYEVAINAGFVGTEQEWLDSLKGADGVDGIDGVDGTDTSYKLYFNQATVEADQSSTYYSMNSADASAVTEIYISNRHLGSSDAINSNEFVGDLKAGASFTVQGVTLARMAEYKLTADAVVLGVNSFKLTVTNVYYQWTTQPDQDELFWFGFHQVAGSGAVSPDNKVGITASDTTPSYLNEKLTLGGEFTKEVVNLAGNEALLLKFTGRIHNTARTFYHNLISVADAIYNVTLPLKSGTIALLGDMHPDPAIALSDRTTPLVPAENDEDMPITRAQTFTAFKAYVTTAPTDANISIDVLLNGTIIATIVILIGQNIGTTTAISNTSGLVDDILKFDLTQVGATIAGAGLKCFTLSNLV